MKKLLSAFGFLLCVSAATAQKLAQTAVPAPVVKTFETQFKSPAKVEWEKKTNHYEVKFEINKINHKAKIDGTGKLLRVDTDIKHTDLPAAVQKAITTQYAGYKIKDPEKFDEGGKITYKVELKKDGAEDQKVHFNPDGTVAKKKAD
ncbi:PepSY-like domain-containing protein [Paraflavitalea pollutisoli]|uniref:PepSY-like domain-containing protein n=1 Tax=Paraflavitalea pollutisoli TaxID=3034143 RepID=UPI0023EAD2D2|nr:PepSY-like domain-containing protein [Paraflavitalea sp. H1-2-19X]